MDNLPQIGKIAPNFLTGQLVKHGLEVPEEMLEIR